MDDIILPKKPQIYSCILCDFVSSNKKDYGRHLLSLKHQKETNGLQNGDKITPENPTQFICSCGKKYKHRQGLWKHKKDCYIEDVEDNKMENIVADKNDDKNIDKDLILMLIKQNTELLEVIKNGTHNTDSHNTTTNSYNKAFNLQFFLNETCKDAMNIMDFVDSIQLQLSDLERVGEKGYIDGISNIIIQNLKGLDVSQRPVHCTDKKRETIYVKDENIWEKDEEKLKMHKLVRKVQDKNFKMIQKFREKYPDYNKASSRHSDTYNNIIIESMGGRGDNDFEKEEKIIHKVSKEVVVEK